MYICIYVFKYVYIHMFIYYIFYIHVYVYICVVVNIHVYIVQDGSLQSLYMALWGPSEWPEKMGDWVVFIPINGVMGPYFQLLTGPILHASIYIYSIYIYTYGGFLKWWHPKTMGFPTKNDHFGVFGGYHYLRKHPYSH